MKAILGILIAGNIFASCVTSPSGYNRIGRTDVCVRSDLGVEESGLGTVIPFFSSAQTSTVLVPAKLVDAQNDLSITVFYSMRSPINRFEGGVLDKTLGLYKIENGEDRRLSDSIESPSFRYNCTRSLTDGLERCNRFANIGGWTYGSSFVDAKNWKIYEVSIKKVFAQKLIQLCDQI